MTIAKTTVLCFLVCFLANGVFCEPEQTRLTDGATQENKNCFSDDKTDLNCGDYNNAAGCLFDKLPTETDKLTESFIRTFTKVHRAILSNNTCALTFWQKNATLGACGKELLTWKNAANIRKCINGHQPKNKDEKELKKKLLVALDLFNVTASVSMCVDGKVTFCSNCTTLKTSIACLSGVIGNTWKTASKLAFIPTKVYQSVSTQLVGQRCTVDTIRKLGKCTDEPLTWKNAKKIETCVNAYTPNEKDRSTRRKDTVQRVLKLFKVIMALPSVECVRNLTDTSFCPDILKAGLCLFNKYEYNKKDDIDDIRASVGMWYRVMERMVKQKCPLGFVKKIEQDIFNPCFSDGLTFKSFTKLTLCIAEKMKGLKSKRKTGLDLFNS